MTSFVSEVVGKKRTPTEPFELINWFSTKLQAGKFFVFTQAYC